MHWRLERTLDQVRRVPRAWRSAAWRARARNFPRDGDGLVRLHIGCGEIAANGFVNVDARRYPHVHLVTQDLFALQMIPDGAASLVYMCHVLEHVSFRLVHRVLIEMRRVLAPGGTLRLSVPDLDLILLTRH
ncbi:MAG: methyltransferase domain-containing protein [Burkholderiales bacterium]|nr:methyltransferase domain-containing protein [Burkholderiales bacterium]